MPGAAPRMELHPRSSLLPLVTFFELAKGQLRWVGCLLAASCDRLVSPTAETEVSVGKRSPPLYESCVCPSARPTRSNQNNFETRGYRNHGHYRLRFWLYTQSTSVLNTCSHVKVEEPL